MPEVGDHYIGAEILLSRGDQMARGHVVARSQDANANVMGRSHTNPILDTRTYQVEFTGGKVTVHHQHYCPMQFRWEWVLTPRCAGWLSKWWQGHFPIRPTDDSLGQTSNPYNHCRLENLQPVEGRLYLKSHPVQTAEFAVAQGTEHEPAFNWWVKHVLKKRDRIIASIRSGKSDT